MSAELWRSPDESQPVLAVALPTVHSVFLGRAFGIPELKEQSPAVPVLMTQQPATLHSLAAGSVMKRIFKQGDPSSPLPFNSALEHVSRKLQQTEIEWDTSPSGLR
jgi:hypothetical protein